MGFFSQDCTSCGHPLLSGGAVTPGVNNWMNNGVAIQPDGRISTGTYDGYGRLEGGGGDDGYDWTADECPVGDQATVWHQACWETAGKPADYRGPSPGSEDQGWFFDNGDHDMTDPRQGRPGALAAALTDDGPNRIIMPPPAAAPAAVCGAAMPVARARCVLGTGHAGAHRSTRT